MVMNFLYATICLEEKPSSEAVTYKESEDYKPQHDDQVESDNTKLVTLTEPNKNKRKTYTRPKPLLFDESLSRKARSTFLDKLIPWPENFLGKNNPFYNLDPPKNLSDEEEATTSTIFGAVPILSTTIPAAAVSHGGRTVRIVRRRLSAKDIIIGRNNQVKLKRKYKVKSTTTIGIPTNQQLINQQPTASIPTHKRGRKPKVNPGNPQTNTIKEMEIMEKGNCDSDIKVKVENTTTIDIQPTASIPTHRRGRKPKGDQKNPQTNTIKEMEIMEKGNCDSDRTANQENINTLNVNNNNNSNNLNINNNNNNNEDTITSVSNQEKCKSPELKCEIENVKQELNPDRRYLRPRYHYPDMFKLTRKYCKRDPLKSKTATVTTKSLPLSTTTYRPRRKATTSTPLTPEMRAIKRENVNRYFDFFDRVESGEKFSILAKYTSLKGDEEKYLIEWIDGPSSSQQLPTLSEALPSQPSTSNVTSYIISADGETKIQNIDNTLSQQPNNADADADADDRNGKDHDKNDHDIKIDKKQAEINNWNFCNTSGSEDKITIITTTTTMTTTTETVTATTDID